MSEKLDYKTGAIATPKQHSELLPAYLQLELDQEKNYYIKVVGEAKFRTYEQIKAFKGLTRLLHEANCLNERLDSWDKIQYFYKLKTGLIKQWVKMEDGKIKFYTEPTAGSYAEVKSCAGMTKKELTELIKAVLVEADLNIDNMSLEMQKRYNDIRSKMEDRR